jgi:regulator of protease activity HflC (stomatin/prohibitin superfamily)
MHYKKEFCMLGFTKIVIGDGERGLRYVDRQFKNILTPGVYKFWNPRGRTAVKVLDIATSEYAGRDGELLIERLGANVGEHFLLADIGAQEIGLLSRNGKVDELLSPGARKLYWKASAPMTLQRLSLASGAPVPAELAVRLKQLGALDKFAVSTTVQAESTGLLFVDGKFVRSLDPGAYAFWNFQKNVVLEAIDLRVQALEVAGQELLTRDKVSLRVNLTGSLRVVDPVAARTKVVKYMEFVYRELQFGLRKAISAKTLDELLGDKASLDADIFQNVRKAVGDFGLELLSVGVKDVILPGEMKDILNGVVQAEKTAQANVIRRREEANATRSLLNTAKLIDESPTLMRLKELEALEKVTEKIDKLTVFGGLEGVLKQLVTLKV